MLLNPLYAFDNLPQKTFHISRSRYLYVYRFDKALKGVGADNILEVELKKNNIKNKIINIIPAFLEGRREKASAMQTAHVGMSLSPCTVIKATCAEGWALSLSGRSRRLLLIIYTLKISST